MQHAARTKFLVRALAVTLVVVAHAFVLNLAHPPTVGLGFAYAASAICLGAAAALLWHKTSD